MALSRWWQEQPSQVRGLSKEYLWPTFAHVPEVSGLPPEYLGYRVLNAHPVLPVRSIKCLKLYVLNRGPPPVLKMLTGKVVGRRCLC